MPGVTLSQKLAEGPLSEPEVISLGIQLAEALEVAHTEGLVHRDLKPGNVMITSGGQAKILDFGLAQLLQPRSDEATTEALSEALAPAGTLPYGARAAQGRAGRRARRRLRRRGGSLRDGRRSPVLSRIPLRLRAVGCSIGALIGYLIDRAIESPDVIYASR
jgi:serine/threonine protein kinase